MSDRKYRLAEGTSVVLERTEVDFGGLWVEIEGEEKNALSGDLEGERVLFSDRREAARRIIDACGTMTEAKGLLDAMEAEWCWCVFLDTAVDYHLAGIGVLDDGVYHEIYEKLLGCIDACKKTQFNEGYEGFWLDGAEFAIGWLYGELGMNQDLENFDLVLKRFNEA